MVNAHFQDETNNHHDRLEFADIGQHAGGTKGISGRIYAKGGNYVDLDCFLTWLTLQKWYYPEMIHVLVHRDYGGEMHYYHNTLDQIIHHGWPDVGYNPK
jgi:hypothetical protein